MTPKPADHPHNCRTCHGAGLMDDRAITTTVGGHPHEYRTMTTCTHPWFKDPGSAWDPYYDDPVNGDHPAARAAFATGYAQGRADRAEFHTCPCTHCTRQEVP